MRFAVTLLVDPQGWVLLQERDSQAPRAPDKWAMVGGHVEPDEEPDAAVVREIAEETGLAVSVGSGPGQLRLWSAESFRYADGSGGEFHVYAGSTHATDSDIVLGEGRQIVFVEPGAASGLDQAESLAYFLPRFLDSSVYRELIAQGDR